MNYILSENIFIIFYNGNHGNHGNHGNYDV